MKIATAYHGTSGNIRSVASIKINERSTEQFYGPAFYVNFRREGAEYYGRKIFEVKFNKENMYNAISYFDIRTLGVFEDFLDIVRGSAEEYLTQEQLDSDDVDKYIERHIKKNYKSLLDEYIGEQSDIRGELEEDYDGIIDATQCAIFQPQKVITEIKFVGERASDILVIL